MTGLTKRFPKPDIAPGQHVMPLTAGRIAIRNGVTSRSDSLEITMFERGRARTRPGDDEHDAVEPVW